MQQRHFVDLARKTPGRVETNTGVVAGPAGGGGSWPSRNFGLSKNCKKILLLCENFRQKLRNSGQAPI